MDVYTRRAYSEVSAILNNLGNYYRDKLPGRLIAFFEREKEKDYVPNIVITKPVKEQAISRKAIAILSGINIQYWCGDQEKKKRLNEMYKRNGFLYRSELFFEWMATTQGD